MFKGLAVSAAVIACAGLLACDEAASLQTPTATPRSEQSTIDLTGAEVGRSSILAEEAELVNVKIEVIQQGDEYAMCGSPTLLDSFGNSVAVLSAVDYVPGVRATYYYAFYATSKGEYTVLLDNRECLVRQTAAEALVVWTVKPSGL